MKQRISTPDGGKKKVDIPRVGLVLWNGESGALELTGDDAYMAVTKAIAGMMLVVDQVNLIAVPRASIYPMYGNTNAVRVVLDVVTVNIGDQVVHDVESLKPWLGALGKQVEDMGLHKPSAGTPVTDLNTERQRRTPDDRGNVPPWNPK